MYDHSFVKMNTMHLATVKISGFKSIPFCASYGEKRLTSQIKWDPSSFPFPTFQLGFSFCVQSVKIAQMFWYLSLEIQNGRNPTRLSANK